MAFDVEAARKAGYTDAEIAAHLASTRQFDVAAAKKAGYSDTELISYLSGADLTGNEKAKQIPVEPGANTTPEGEKPTSITDKIVGTGEAALSTVTGLTGGAAGMVAGTIGGVAGSVLSGEFGTPEGVKNIERAAAKGAETLTYSPRTASGQEQAQAVGKAMQQVIPVAPVLPGIPVAAKPAIQSVRAGAQSAEAARAATLQAVRAKVMEAAARRQAANDPAMPTPGTMGSVGAAGTDIATIRRQTAQELPVPLELTKGQATRNFEQQRFEQEIAKDPNKGSPIRDRVADQRQAIWKNFDVWVDETGSQLTEAGAVGDAVTGALRQRAAADKARIRVAYKQAEKAGDMEVPVDLTPVADYLNANRAGRSAAPILQVLADELKVQEVGTGSLAEGTLKVDPVRLKQAEEIRKAINRFAKNTDPNDMRVAGDLKRIIDTQTEGLGGGLYQQARVLRKQYADRYENFGLARDLMGMKRGTNDAQVAAEKVFQRAILTAPMADVRQLGLMLKSGGEPGRQAWAELQGATVRHIRDQAMRNAARDERGTPIPSVKALQDEIGKLDRAGKLDYMFGKKGAEQLRAIEELSKVVFTAPPGAVNTSNTASVLLAALDIATSGVAGFPLPVMSGLRILTTHVKDRQIQKRINEALGIKPEPKKVKAPRSILPRSATDATRAPENRTVH
jgi:hypothetical protein